MGPRLARRAPPRRAPSGRVPPRPVTDQRRSATGVPVGASERTALLVATALAALAAALWLAGALGLALHGRNPSAEPFSSSLVLLFGVLAHPSSPSWGWPQPLRRELLPAPLLYLVVLVILGVPLGVAVAARRWRIVFDRASPGPARWATKVDLGAVLLSAPTPGRLVVGSLGRQLVATEAGHSLLVFGPTQSGKTSGLAIPALLEWHGPVIATSVKNDLVRDTRGYREGLGRVQIFDPTGAISAQGSGWSPLPAAVSWPGARRVAAGLCSVASERGGGLEDSGFWYATAEKLLAPLLFAAANAGGSMADVLRWVDAGERDEVLDVLEALPVEEALLAALASFRRDERQLSSVYTTAETILAAFADPGVLAACDWGQIDPDALLDGGANTLYLVAPAHAQERLAPVFVALLREVLEHAFERSESNGGRLSAPFLVVLDEAANVAPLDGLDTLASTASSYGIQLVTIFQDLAQLEARYGRRGATVLNNHRAKLVCSGISDPTTLSQMSELIGDAEQILDAHSIDPDGRRTTTHSVVEHRLAPADQLRRLASGEAVLLYGNLPPMRLRLRPFFADPALRALALVGAPRATELATRRAGRRWFGRRRAAHRTKSALRREGSG
jgi:type IV secretion system protein VirD4